MVIKLNGISDHLRNAEDNSHAICSRFRVRDLKACPARSDPQ